MMLRQMVQESATQGASSKPANLNPGHDAIAALAYQLWVLRARPIGSPEVDWFRAEEELKNASRSVPRTA
jgi:hypothetical protein